MNIVERNLFRLLRAGAFTDTESIEPMSPYKWRSLVGSAIHQGLTVELLKGIETKNSDKWMNIPEQLCFDLRRNIDEAHKQKRTLTENDIRFSSKMKNHKLKSLINNELHNIDTSVESIDLLEIIISNLTDMLNSDIYLDGIINLGQYLRNKGDKVDFVKIDRWLDQLGIRKMAELQGSILIRLFGFEKDEIPYLRAVRNEAETIAINAIAKKNSYIANNIDSDKDNQQERDNRIKKNVNRNFKYYKYAPLETTCNVVYNIGRSIKDIEE